MVSRIVARRVIFAGAVLVLSGVLTHFQTGSVRAFQGSLSTGWHRHTFQGTHAQVTFSAVYPASPGFLAVSQGMGWVSRDGQRWTATPGSALTYALKHHIPDLNLVRLGMVSGLKGDTYSIKAEGPHGGYIAVGSHKPAGKPYNKTRGEIALSPDGRSWHTVSGTGAAFTGVTITDVARGGPGWVAVGFRWGPAPIPVVWTSTDATHWRRLPHQPLGTNNEVSSVLKGPTGLLAVTNGLDGPGTIWASSDGTHWQKAAGDPFRGAIIQQVTTGGPGYLAVGEQDDDPALWQSEDGVHWQEVATAAAFPGDLTALDGVASQGETVVIVGRYQTVTHGRLGWQPAPAIGSSWTWTARSSTVPATPIPRTSIIDPKRFRLRQSDLPAGFVEHEFGGFSDFCDDGSTLCRSVFKAVGSYGAYETSFSGPTNLAAIQSMAIEGTRSNPHALAALGTKLVRWWNRGGALTRVAAPFTIGQETRIYRGSPPAPSNPPGGNLVAFAVEWRDGKAIGQVYLEQEPQGPVSTIEALAVNLARSQWQHFRDARQ